MARASSDSSRQQRQHRLLARVRDVEAVEAGCLGRVDQLRRSSTHGPILDEVDQADTAVQPVILRFLLVQRGRKGFLNPLADQTTRNLLFAISALVAHEPGQKEHE